jgi:serine/threonine protein kinase
MSYDLISDIGPLNLMMNETQIIPGGSHFCRPWSPDGLGKRVLWEDRCSVPHVDYYYIDFGFSSFYDDRDTATATDRRGQVQEAPELFKDVPYNPFKLDIYRLGFVFLQETQVCT